MSSRPSSPSPEESGAVLVVLAKLARGPVIRRSRRGVRNWSVPEGSADDAFGGTRSVEPG
ncbi:hypothetical protein SMICM17S_07405 [Streptomyces microflavus]